jgi:hypothetical protein
MSSELGSVTKKEIVKPREGFPSPPGYVSKD